MVRIRSVKESAAHLNRDLATNEHGGARRGDRERVFLYRLCLVSPGVLSPRPVFPARCSIRDETLRDSDAFGGREQPGGNRERARPPDTRRTLVKRESESVR